MTQYPPYYPAGRHLGSLALLDKL
ncbi:hypothetical protein OOU_Y34scaffold00134g9 [Pyricularia oryzae Y34]|uniref:Uncharacterized protein n=2 Tax=Pyricularia oryzae TaxID=318829 RepID=A0AA97PR04_PYRO3|nr:hypothetical protein OOU_Y34scaffold00134g9 [Pyricularia oryzae Y34]